MVYPYNYITPYLPAISIYMRTVRVILAGYTASQQIMPIDWVQRQWTSVLDRGASLA